MIGDKTIRAIGANVKADLRKELRDQGHYLTGELDHSITDKYEENKNGQELDIEALDYIQDVNDGIAPNHIDVTDLSYIRGLAEYAKKRFGITNDNEALRAAFRIAAKHRKEGMPTRNSYQFSTTGERTEAIETSYNERENELIIDQEFSKELDTLIDNTFDQTIF